jgi:hypothetical protein
LHAKEHKWKQAHLVPKLSEPVEKQGIRDFGKFPLIFGFSASFCEKGVGTELRPRPAPDVVATSPANNYFSNFPQLGGIGL